MPAFNQQAIKEVQDARRGMSQGLQMGNGPTITDEEWKKLMLLLYWDHVNVVIQGNRIIPLTEPDRTLNMGSIKDTPETELQRVMPPGSNVLIAIGEGQLDGLRQLTRRLYPLQLNRLDLLILSETDRQMFPAVYHMGDTIPWRTTEISKFSRPIHRVNAVPIYAFVALSTSDSRSNGIQPKHSTIRLPPADQPLTRTQVELPQPPHDLYAIQIATDRLGDLHKYLKLTGSQCVAKQGKLKRDTRVIFRPVEQSQHGTLVAHWATTPHFALMSIPEWTGEAVDSSKCVIEIFCRSAHKSKNGAFLWATMHRQTKAKEIDAVIQYVGRNKIRLGINDSASEDRFRSELIPEMSAQGYLFKDERSGSFIDSESSSDTGSSTTGYASSDLSEEESIVLIDVPDWYNAQQVETICQGENRSVSRVSPLNWTSGDINKSAWRIDGVGIMCMTDSIISDPRSNTRITTQTWRHYYQEKRESMNKRNRYESGQQNRDRERDRYKR